MICIFPDRGHIQKNQPTELQHLTLLVIFNKIINRVKTKKEQISLPFFNYFFNANSCFSAGLIPSLLFSVNTLVLRILILEFNASIIPANAIAK